MSRMPSSLTPRKRHVKEVPLEEAELARKAFGNLTEGEREVVREALAVMGRDPG
ncbi:hypothetical protein [Streptomyces sp. 6-11-2]|uniref:hypothetical protein n=1 Tax=Streptomyces sp. 6-11-2 TaxID=2585753 RepID=UPI001175AC6A|nr:hypothetical protein [Streptomyces sp. 6-11-2]GED86383.1 hypothetical protein TNCT6_34680 [Streptomyces sp. 6-11-2]